MNTRYLPIPTGHLRSRHYRRRTVHTDVPARPSASDAIDVPAAGREDGGIRT